MNIHEGRPTCEATGKVPFHSKQEARRAMVGALKSKRVRVYTCPAHPDHLHISTQTGNMRLRSKR